MSIETLTLAMTGASGAPYTLRLMQLCLQADIRIQFICSQPGNSNWLVTSMLILPAFTCMEKISGLLPLRVARRYPTRW